MESLIFIGQIKRQLGSSYPYCAGTVTIYCPNYNPEIVAEIVNYFRKKEFSIVLNYIKKEITISGYCSEF